MILLSFYLIEVFTLIKQKYGSDIFKFFFYVIFRFYIKRNYLTFCFIFSPGLPVITDLIQNRCFNPKSFLFQSGLPTSLWVCDECWPTWEAGGSGGWRRSRVAGPHQARHWDARLGSSHHATLHLPVTCSSTFKYSYILDRNIIELYLLSVHED